MRTRAERRNFDRLMKIYVVRYMKMVNYSGGDPTKEPTPGVIGHMASVHLLDSPHWSSRTMRWDAKRTRKINRRMPIDFD